MKQVRRVILQIETSRAWGRALLSGIARYSRVHGPWASYHISESYLGMSRKIMKSELALLKNWKADGIITREITNVEDVLAAGVPTVIAHDGGSTPGYPCVISNYHETGRMAAEYLYDRGFQDFAFCGMGDEIWSYGRCEGFCEWLAEKGMSVNVYEQPRSKAKRTWAYESNYLAKWIASLPKPVALMTACDLRSQHVTEACFLAGASIPEQVAVLGSDNDQLLCDISNPTLSSVAFNTETAGYAAAQLLDALMDGDTSQKEKVIVAEPIGVVTRQSTDILALDDPEVVKALRYIRRNSKQLLQVGDVVQATKLSRRSLEHRFRRALNRSILEEIRRVHADEMAKMLVETNLPIADIALKLGHYSIENIGRYFEKAKGMRPSAYRKKYGMQ